MVIESNELGIASDAVIVDCRFALHDVNEGRAAYETGHIPGAHYLALDTDLSGPVHHDGGRHPLPGAYMFAQRLASLGIAPATRVIAYEDSRFAFAARLWWMMQAIGYRPPELLNGGYSAWLSTGGKPETGIPKASTCAVVAGQDLRFSGVCAIDSLGELQAGGAVLVDSREATR